MSRSRRKNPFIGIAGDSDKQDKRKANRKLRRVVKETLHMQDADDIENLPTAKEVSNVWSFTKDGKWRLDPDDEWTEKSMRK